MKKYNSLFLAFTVSFTIILMGCGKYPEGPDFSLSSKKGRVANEWKVEYAFDHQDTVEITQDFAGEVWIFDKDGNFQVEDNSVVEKSGTWEFISDKEVIQVNITGTGSSTDTHTILKLKAKEMWLNEEGEVEIHFVPN